MKSIIQEMPTRRFIRALQVSLMLACSFGAPLLSANQDEGARLPQKTVDTNVESPGTVIEVSTGKALQRALQRARPGDIIELEAGATFTGPFILPRKPAGAEMESQWITLRSSGSGAALPPPGVRVSPAHADAMAKLETASGFVLETAPGAHHYRFVGLEFRPAAGPGPKGEGVFLNSLIHFGVTGADGDQLPHHFIVERCYLHGDPEVGTRRGIILNSGAAAVVDSYFSDFKMTGADSQAMIGWEGPGPYRIENNYLEAAGENLMFGGADPAVADRVPSDIEIRRNHFSRPTAWKAGAPDFAGTTWSVKNLFELKNARRVRVEGNLFEYNWPESQNGFAILFTVRNQDGQSPWSVVEDVTFSNNIVRHVANGILILGEDDNYSSGRTRRIQIRNNLFEDLGGNWGEGDFIKIVEGAEDVVVEYNTVLNSGHILMSHGRPQPGFVFRSNIVFHNQAGIVGTDMAPGIDALERYFPDAVMRENLIVGGRADHYPDDNGFPESTAEIGLGNPSQREFGPEDTRLLRAGREAGVKFPELCAALAQTESPIRC